MGRFVDVIFQSKIVACTHPSMFNLVGGRVNDQVMDFSAAAAKSKLPKVMLFHTTGYNHGGRS
jgi:ABC-type maltose transport system permease subunit